MFDNLKNKFIALILIFINYSYPNESVKNLLKLEPKSMIKIDYINKDLEYVLLEIAAFKNLNILIPQENQKLNAKISLQLKDKISVEDAWNLVLEMLTISGYSLKEQQNVFTVIKNSSIAAEQLPTFINEIPPISENPVKYLYFFKNISLNNKQSVDDIELILKDMLSLSSQGANSANYMFIVSSNALMITDKASIINGVMNIIKTIDLTGFKESIAVVPLRYTKSANVLTVLNALIPDNKNPVPFNNFYKREKTKQDKFFSEDTKITSIDQSNSIVILGNKDAISQVKDFIYKYIDIPIETDQSVVDIIKLDYLDCFLFAPTLQALISSSNNQNQSTSTSNSLGLKDVLIIPEQQQAQQQQTTQDGQTQPTVASGGNSLIIAARAQDMKMIKRIIKEMDQPEPQVILESVIVLLDQKQVRQLGFLDTRSPNNPSNPYLIKWQGNTQGQDGGAILNYISTDGSVPSCSGTIDSMKGLAADILQPCVGTSSTGNILTSNAESGSLLVSFNDACGNVATLLKLLDQYSITNVVSEPFIIVKNNQAAVIKSNESRLVRGSTQSQSTGGPIVINQEVLNASLELDITPRIANDGTINLKISSAYSNFPNTQQSDDNTIIARTITTNTNLKNGETLVIGGVASTEIVGQTQKSPFGNIPLLGWLFKKQKRIPTNNNVYIFITPTIVHNANDASNNQKEMVNRIKHDKLHFTEKKIDELRDTLQGEMHNLYGNNFEGLRDPITRVFFKPETDPASQKSGDYIPLF